MISRDCGTEGPKIVTDCPQHGAKRGEVQTPRDRLARPRHRQLKTAPILDRGGVGQIGQDDAVKQIGAGKDADRFTVFAGNN